MSDIEQEVIYSSLCQPLERDGKRVEVIIYADGEGGWLLEVEDEHGNSTVWDQSFATDQAALDEAHDAVAQDGIDSLIGPPSTTRAQQRLDNGLSVAELDELDTFLTGGSIEATAMDVSTLEGYLTAIAIGPRLVMPSEWMPRVWDMYQGATQPDFLTQQQAQQIMSLLMRLYNGLLQAFATDPAAFEPLFSRDSQHSPEQWCEGFLLGAKFDLPAWRSLINAQTAWFHPIMSLGITDDADDLASAADLQSWMNDVRQSLPLIHAHWKTEVSHPSPSAPSVPTRSAPKVGRNDPCPCGSGKKFKKCCGVD